jgi:opacity protein-like surface antigen
MKRLVLGSVAVIAIGVSIAAQAADMAVKAPPPATPAAPYNWSGFYVGGNFGGAWTSGNLTIPGDNFYSGLTEFIGGVVVAGLGLSDRAGTNDLSFRHRLVGPRIGFAGQSAAVRRPAKDVYNHVGTAGCNGRGPLRQGGS